MARGAPAEKEAEDIGHKARRRFRGERRIAEPCRHEGASSAVRERRERVDGKGRR